MLETLGRRIGDARGYAELRWQTNDSTQLSMRRGALLANASSRQSGVSARCYHEGLFGFAARPESSDAALTNVLRDAADNAGRTRGRRTLGPLPVTAGSGTHDHRSTRPLLSTVERIDLLRRLDAYVAQTYPGLLNVDLSIGTTGTEKALVTTDGAATYSYVPRTTIAVIMSLQANDSVVDIYDVFGGFGDADASLLDEATIRAGIDALYESLRRKAEGTYCEAGLHDVVLAPHVTGILAHEAIGHTCEADCVLSGSIAGEHLGRMVAAEKITLCDYAGRGPDGRAAIALHVDDEGTPCRDVAIIERGVLKALLHDKETALRFGAEPTGNARAFGFADYPIVRMRNTAIAPGTDTLADMIASIDRGYYLQRATNGQADSTGEFMFGISLGYEIRNGKLGRAIRDTTISGVAFDMLKTVTHVGDTIEWAPSGWCGKGQWIQVGMGGPPIRCKVTVGGR